MEANNLIQAVCDHGVNLDIDLKKIGFICNQHLLETSVPLFEALIKLGANPDNIFTTGKHYSAAKSSIKKIKNIGCHVTVPFVQKNIGTFDNVFNEQIKTLVSKAIFSLKEKVEIIFIIDHGGACLKEISQYITSSRNNKILFLGIEQTSSGFQPEKVNKYKIPVIDVARSAVKKNIESKYIAEVIIEKSKDFINFNRNSKIGIVGFGAIGQSLFEEFSKLNITPCIHDNFHSNINSKITKVKESLTDVIKYSDYIFGCTGFDLFKKINNSYFYDMRGLKTFVSCSSKDTEFLSLIKLHCSHDEIVTNDLQINITDNLVFKVKNGGFPINFDHSGVSVPMKKIQVTRALMLSAVIQLLVKINTYKKQTDSIIKLDTVWQDLIKAHFTKNEIEIA